MENDSHGKKNNYIDLLVNSAIPLQDRFPKIKIMPYSSLLYEASTT